MTLRTLGQVYPVPGFRIVARIHDVNLFAPKSHNRQWYVRVERECCVHVCTVFQLELVPPSPISVFATIPLLNQSRAFPTFPSVQNNLATAHMTSG